MSGLQIRSLALAVAMLSACGQQLVEFPLGDAAGGNPDASLSGDGGMGIADARVVDGAMPTADARFVDGATVTADARIIDAPTGIGIDAATVADGPLAADSGVTDAPIVVTDAPIAIDGAIAVTDAPAVDAGGNDALLGPPIVVSSNPADQAMNVSVNRMIQVTFDRPMDEATINDQTFILMEGQTPISGQVTYDLLTFTATFDPDDPLDIGLTYTAIVTTGAEDVTGQPLAMDDSFMFTVGACSLEPVALLGAASFGVLAGSTVTNTGPTVVIGDVGVSPGTAVTGFGTGEPGIIVGTLHAGDGAAATAIGNLNTAYLDAAGRTLCPISVSGNLGGDTLTPGLYKSTGDLAIDEGDLILDAQGDPQAVFIFQIAMIFNVTTGRRVILINNARAQNIFWQVGSSATIGTGAVIYGNIMADQSISLATGTVLFGRALAHIGAVTLDSNMVTAMP